MTKKVIKNFGGQRLFGTCCSQIGSEEWTPQAHGTFNSEEYKVRHGEI